MKLALYSLPRTGVVFMSDSIFGISEPALQLCEDRAVMLTNNIVNSTTPHYKARDIDFQKLLKNANDNTAMGGQDNSINSQPAMYRVPMQKSMDGNTVDEEIERKNFLENALRYQVNLTFIQNKSDQLMKAIKGE